MTIVRVPVFYEWTQSGSGSGTFASRPAATSVAGGYVYTCTDTGVSYLSSGYDWYLVETTSAGGTVTESSISLSDVTTDNVTSSAHGFAPKSPADATKFLNGDTTPAYAQVKDSDLSTSDITTNNASTSKHGFLKKLDNNSAHFMDGTGAWSTPSGSGGSVATDTIWDAKGDLAAGTGADTAAKLTVGSNDQVLVADSSQTTGLRWGGIDGGSA